MLEKEKLSKGKDISYKSLQLQDYLQAKSNLIIENMKNIMKIRIRDLHLKSNFPNHYTDKICLAPECNAEETNKHVFSCSFLGDPNEIVETSLEYDMIFKKNVEVQLKVEEVFMNRMKRRKTLFPPNFRGALDPRKRKRPILGIRDTRRNSRRKRNDRMIKVK